MPTTVIEGQLAPFTFSRNEEENMVCEFLRDFDQARERRGLLFATAGPINNGSRLTGMRLIMAAIQNFGRYDQRDAVLEQSWIGPSLHSPVSNRIATT